LVGFRRAYKTTVIFSTHTHFIIIQKKGTQNKEACEIIQETNYKHTFPKYPKIWKISGQGKKKTGIFQFLQEKQSLQQN